MPGRRTPVANDQTRANHVQTRVPVPRTAVKRDRTTAWSRRTRGPGVRTQAAKRRTPCPNDQTRANHRRTRAQRGGTSPESPVTTVRKWRTPLTNPRTRPRKRSNRAKRSSRSSRSNRASRSNRSSRSNRAALPVMSGARAFSGPRTVRLDRNVGPTSAWRVRARQSRRTPCLYCEPDRKRDAVSAVPDVAALDTPAGTHADCGWSVAGRPGVLLDRTCAPHPRVGCGHVRAGGHRVCTASQITGEMRCPQRLTWPHSTRLRAGTRFDRFAAGRAAAVRM